MRKTWLAVIFLANTCAGLVLNAGDFGLHPGWLGEAQKNFVEVLVTEPVKVSKSSNGGIMDGFALGINYPWLNCGWDFGDTAWGHRGISTPASRAIVAADFVRMRASGAKVVRWFVMADGRASPEFDSRGMVTGFDKFFYADMDAALEIAKANDIKLVLVLFDFKLLDDAKVINGVQTGGRANLVKDPAAMRSLFDNALIPLFERYGNHPAILAWEVMNEPEVRMKGFVYPGARAVGSQQVLGFTKQIAEKYGNHPSTFAWRGMNEPKMGMMKYFINFGAKTVEPYQMHNFARQVATLVHAHTSQLVTLGSVMSSEVAQWKGVGLDFYQYHYYDYMALMFEPFDVKYSEMKLDKPCVLGEFGTKSIKPLKTYLNTMLNNGFAGAWAWSYRAEDVHSNFNSIADLFADWAKAHK